MVYRSFGLVAGIACHTIHLGADGAGSVAGIFL